eukprot:TRINITY_DN84553_c0_g1_i2.p1 TRINITY_DN84553_c0_g1~~TRINITY_DN84553_c0_g1_i2.p1  ORF type:complete len:330 (+),score=17.67 TRINITY_DN84553_c0_g1_i2:1040-2029(+)
MLWTSELQTQLSSWEEEGDEVPVSGGRDRSVETPLECTLPPNLEKLEVTMHCSPLPSAFHSLGYCISQQKTLKSLSFNAGSCDLTNYGLTEFFEGLCSDPPSTMAYYQVKSDITADDEQSALGASTSYEEWADAKIKLHLKEFRLDVHAQKEIGNDTIKYLVEVLNNMDRLQKLDIDVSDSNVTCPEGMTRIAHSCVNVGQHLTTIALGWPKFSVEGFVDSMQQLGQCGKLSSFGIDLSMQDELPDNIGEVLVNGITKNIPQIEQLEFVLHHTNVSEKTLGLNSSMGLTRLKQLASLQCLWLNLAVTSIRDIKCVYRLLLSPSYVLHLE